MKYSRQSIARFSRWVLIAPVLPISIWMSMMGLIGLGFGAGPFMLGYVCSVPAFFLNMISPRWGAAGAFAVVALDYIPRAILNWPLINPLVLLTARADGLLVLNLILNISSAVAWERIANKTRTTSEGAPV